MLTFRDLLRAIIEANLEVLTLIVPILFVVNLFGLRKANQECRQALRTGVRKRSQLR